MALGPLQLQDPEEGSVRVITVGHWWSGRDAHMKLLVTCPIPAEWDGRTPVGLFDFGETGLGNAQGFESLMCLNGMPYQGVDSYHAEVILPKTAVGSTLELEFDLWSGLEGGGPPRTQHHQIRQAELAWLDVATDDLYYTSWAMFDAATVLGSHDY